MLNQCNFIGNLGADPDIHLTQDGRKIANLRLAVTQAWRDKSSGERREKTEWVTVVIYADGLAKIAEQYLRKGSRVFVSGKMQTRKWQDQSGNDRYSTEIVLQGYDSNLILLDGVKSGEGQRPNAGRQSEDNAGDYGAQGGQGNGSGSYDDEIPF